MFAMQPVCNAARAAHALRSDQNLNSNYGLHLGSENLFSMQLLYYLDHVIVDCGVKLTSYYRNLSKYMVQSDLLFIPVEH
jgi:hypothetical protein